MPTIVLLGGAGQIAWRLADWLQSHDSCRVEALCRHHLLMGPHVAFGRTVRVFDENDERSIRENVGDADIVIDCSFSQLRRSTDEVRLRRLYNEILSAPSVRYFVHLSSIAVYGETSRKGQLSFEKPAPDTVYGTQKLRTEKLIRSIASTYQKPVLIVRLGHVYGSWMSWSMTWVEMLMKGDIDSQCRSMPSNAVHIRQACAAIAGAIKNRTVGTWNLIGSPNAIWDEVLEWHRRALQLVSPEKILPSGVRLAAEPRRYSTNIVRTLMNALRMSRSKIIAAVLENPPIANGIQLALYRFPFMPSVSSLKDRFGSPGVEAYFGSVTPDSSYLVFDSIEIPGPTLGEPSPTTETDFDEFAQMLRMMLCPESVQHFVHEQLNQKDHGSCIDN
ncbi:MAG: NAD(P)-dependent oxidoreductase [Terracidiphilus sp.]|jgi:nucleoside-diphosphate-sugar epimerase